MRNKQAILEQLAKLKDFAAADIKKILCLQAALWQERINRKGLPWRKKKRGELQAFLTLALWLERQDVVEQVLFEVLLDKYTEKRMDYELCLISNEEWRQLEERLEPLFIKFVIDASKRQLEEEQEGGLLSD